MDSSEAGFRILEPFQSNVIILALLTCCLPSGVVGSVCCVLASIVHLSFIHTILCAFWCVVQLDTLGFLPWSPEQGYVAQHKIIRPQQFRKVFGRGKSKWPHSIRILFPEREGVTSDLCFVSDTLRPDWFLVVRCDQLESSVLTLPEMCAIYEDVSDSSSLPRVLCDIIVAYLPMINYLGCPHSELWFE
jgi:hypothetical protein